MSLKCDTEALNCNRSHLVLWQIIWRNLHISQCEGKAVPLQASRGPEFSRKLRFLNTWHRKRMVVSLSAFCTGHFYLQEMLLVLVSVRGWADPKAIVLSEGLYQEKIPMTSSGTEPATSRFVAKHPNHCTTAGLNISTKQNYGRVTFSAGSVPVM